MHKFLALMKFCGESFSHGHRPVPYWSPFGVWICVCRACDHPFRGVIECVHCGCRARGYARDEQGNRLCHADDGPDCYRRVTVYREPLGSLASLRVRDLPSGIKDIRLCTARTDSRAASATSGHRCPTLSTR